MLVLTRGVGQRIYIGDDIILEIVSVGGTGFKRNQVRIGIQAPKEVRIERPDRKRRECEQDDARQLDGGTMPPAFPRSNAHDA